MGVRAVILRLAHMCRYHCSIVRLYWRAVTNYQRAFKLVKAALVDDRVTFTVGRQWSSRHSRPTLTGTRCLQNDLSTSDQNTYMTSDASTSFDEGSTFAEKDIVCVFAPQDTPSVGRQQTGLPAGISQPVSTRRKSSNDNEKPTLSAGKPSRMSHSQVERRYRNTIKFHLDILTTKLPALKEVRASTLDAAESSCATKGPSKALVIASAVKHIESLESDNAESKQFIKALQEQIEGLQNLVRASDCAIRQHLQADGVT